MCVWCVVDYSEFVKEEELIFVVCIQNTSPRCIISDPLGFESAWVDEEVVK